MKPILSLNLIKPNMYVKKEQIETWTVETKSELKHGQREEMVILLRMFKILAQTKHKIYQSASGDSCWMREEIQFCSEIRIF